MLAELQAQLTSLEIPDDLCKTQYCEVRPHDQVAPQTTVIVGTKVEQETTCEKPDPSSGKPGELSVL